jgi:hypothetical protein
LGNVVGLAIESANLLPALATAVRSDDMTKELPSPETLRKLLRYEPETGKLFWRERGREFCKNDRYYKTWNSLHANKEAFAQINDQGYKVGSIFNHSYRAHRVIWAMQTGSWPEADIDHIDRNRLNNIWTNLRSATRSQNCANRTPLKNKTSKYHGVCWLSRDKKWQALLIKSDKRVYVGYFSTEIDAAKAYDAAAKKLHGEFAGLNFP